MSCSKRRVWTAPIPGKPSLRVALPLSVPAVAAFTIFQFMWVWNDLLVALVIMNNPESQPMTVRIQALLGTYATEWHIMSSAAFISMAVPLDRLLLAATLLHHRYHRRCGQGLRRG